ncbi:MAG TPA: hypothetical protein VH061_02585 [Solirubrobacteraceae bacterium]|jgi:hypothetical protein|nr:hypothetical protein [Solirubrobacteraceae bacterium]
MGREQAEREEARFAAERDVIYRAVGQYFVAFSVVVGSMRRALGRGFERPGQEPMLVDALFSDLMAMNMARAFFAACSMIADPKQDEVEQEIGKRLNAIVKAAIEDRNELAHGDWMLLQGWEPEAGLEPKLTRFRLTSGNPRPELLDVSPPILDQRSDALQRLHSLVQEYGEICLPEPGWTAPYRVREVFAIEDKRLVRIGWPTGYASRSEFRS